MTEQGLAGATRRRAGRVLAAVVAGGALLLTGCGGSDPAEPLVPVGTTGDASVATADTTSDTGTPPTEPVHACPDGADGEAPEDDGPSGTTTGVSPGVAGGAEVPTPTGPTTVVADTDVTPIEERATSTLPVTVISCDGVEVEVTDTSRIVAADLYGTLGELVYTLGLGDNLVGRDTSTGFGQVADVPVVTPGAHDLSAEAILALDPTVVLTDASIGPPEVQQQLRDSGIAVIFFDDARTMDGIPGQVRAVAGALGVPEQGEALVERIDADITAATSSLAVPETPVRVTFLYVRGSAGVYLMAGPGSGADAMIQSIGAVDVGTDIGLDRPFVPLTSEALIAAQPDVIVVMTKGLESVGGVDGLVDITGIAQTPAGENRRIVDVDDSLLLSFGPRTGQTVQALAEAVYGA